MWKQCDGDSADDSPDFDEMGLNLDCTSSNLMKNLGI